MFGEWSGPFLQFAVAAVVILALVGVVVWLVRRYTAGGLGRIGRGRVPRLAIVDALSVDTRRRLVLVRRDNVEHLILVGGPSDVLVEQAIQRPRRPVAKPQGEALPAAEVVRPAPEVPPAPTPESPVEAPAASAPAEAEAQGNPPIPFPQPRAQPAPASQQRAVEQRSFFSLRRAVGGQSARLEPVSTQLPVPGGDKVEAPAATPPVEAPPEADAEPRAVNAAPTNVSTFAAQPAAARTDDTATKVGDLEREMARLLGEITGKQSS